MGSSQTTAESRIQSGPAAPLTHLSYKIDEKFLLGLYESHKPLLEPYVDTRLGEPSPGLFILRMSPEPFQNIFEDLGVAGKPRFYFLEKGAQIRPHTDDRTACSVNFLLGDTDPAPIIIEGVELHYRSAVLNTRKTHAVNNGDKERLLFKISIFDESYEQVLTRIRFKL